MAFSIEYIYQIADKFSAPLKKMAGVGAKFDTQTSKIQKGLGRMEDKFKSAGSKLANLRTGLASMGAGMFLKGALDDAVKYGDGIARIGTLIPKQNQRLNSLKGTISKLALSMGKDVNDIAGGAFDVISAFGDMEGETEKRLIAVANASKAGGSTTSQALSLLSAVTKSYGDTSGVALQKASDLAFMTNVLGQTTFPEMASAMGKVLPLTAQMGVSQEEIFASMASLTGVTGNTAEVTTQLSAVMSALIKPTGEMSAVIKELEFSSAKAMIKEKGLAGSLSLLSKKTKGSEEAVGKLFGSKEAMTAFFALSGSQANKFADNLKAMGEAGKSAGQVTADALAEMENSSGEKIRKMITLFQGLKISIGDITATTITPLLEKFGAWVTKLKETNPQMLKMVTYFLLSITAIGAVLIPLGLFISAMGTAIGALKIGIAVTKLFSIAQAFMSGAFGLSGASIAITTVATKAYLIGAKLAMIVTKAWSLAQMALNAVLSGNPIALIVLAVIGLITWFVILLKKTGSISGAFKLMGGTIINFLLAPIQLLLFALESLMTVLSKLPGIGGMFEGGVKGLGEMREAIKSVRSDMIDSPSSQIGATDQAPIPQYGYSRGADANASVSVYTEKGMGVKPYQGSGNLGYNMSGAMQ